MITNPNYTSIRDITNERDWPHGKEVYTYAERHQIMGRADACISPDRKAEQEQSQNHHRLR